MAVQKIEQDEDACELNQTQEVVNMAFPTDNDSFEIGKPNKETINISVPPTVPGLSAVYGRRGFAVISVRGNLYGAQRIQSHIEGITAASRVTDDPFCKFHRKPYYDDHHPYKCFMKRSDVHEGGRTQRLYICRHDSDPGDLLSHLDRYPTYFWGENTRTTSNFGYPVQRGIGDPVHGEAYFLKQLPG